jgi:nucleotide-binding universal stress UspA family protein
VLLVRPPAGKTADLKRPPWIGRIVVPLDGSELAERAIDPAIELARACRVHLLLLHILPDAGRLELVPSADRETERRARERDEMKDYLKRQVARVRRAGAHAYGMLLAEPHPAESIADRVEGDVIVMATHGYGRMDRVLLESVTDRVVRAAVCPVIVVPPVVAEAVSPASAAHG